MAEPKTRPTDIDVATFLATIADVRRRGDAETIDAMMREATGEAPVVWGSNIVGYGALEYPGSSGKSASWPIVAFSPRKSELVLYLNTEIEPQLFENLGPHRRGVGCLYLKKLVAVDADALRRIIAASVALAVK